MSMPRSRNEQPTAATPVLRSLAKAASRCAGLALVLAAAGCHQDAFESGPSEAMVSCSKGQLGGLSFSHGVVLSHFPGRTLDSVTLWVGGHIDSTLVYKWEIHRDGFDGPLVRKGSTAVYLSATEVRITLRTASPAAAVESNYTIVLTPVSGSANPWISTFTQPNCTGVNMTQGTTPPLDTPIQVGIPIAAYGKM